MTNIRPERLAIPAVVAVLAWWYLLRGAGMSPAMTDMPEMRATATPAALFVMWAVMMAAMMLPGAVPSIAVRGTPFAVGYVLVWTAFAAAAAFVQLMLDRTGALSATMALRSAPLAAFIVAAVGIYELTPLKRACLRRCRPDDRSRAVASGTGVRAAVVTGLRQGVFCVGCCWALMALPFVAGAMNVVWIVAIALLVVAEKVLPPRVRLDRVAGVALVLCAVAMGWRAVG